jgi:hypothetical protein
MPIDYSKLRSITAREIVRALLSDGFSSKRNVAATADISIAMGDA